MMLRPHAPRRRSRYAPQLCAFIAAFLLLLSISVLHSRISSSPLRLSLPFRSSRSSHPIPDSLFDDADNDAFDASSDDLIDELDDGVDEAGKGDKLSEEDELLHYDDDPESEDLDLPHTGGLFWDHLLAVARRSFGKSSDPFVEEPLFPDISKISFGSDDQPVDDDVRIKLDSITSIEDLMLMKPGSSRDSPLRSGWARWLEGKADFLRRDKMLRSNLELLNPKNHPLLQDPDGAGLASLTKGDRLMQRAIWKEIEVNPFAGAGMKRVERRKTLNLDSGKERRRRWGYFPGLDPYLPFSEFMERFLDSGKCGLRVFMVWNSPPWMYGVRHQRGLESLLHHHRDACVVVFSETMDLDFFSSYVKEGFKIAVVMPNLDELLSDTPAQVFATLWYDWRKTKYYPIHYSELVRLAALYRYGGVYLDSDVVVLRSLASLQNSLAIENQIASLPVYSSTVMSFERNSAFLMECLGEFYSTYDDTRLRWNGAELMTRVISRLTYKEGKSYGQLGVNIEPSFAFFPIGPHNITSYFAEAADEEERTKQDALFAKILNESMTFHFWNGITSALVPEPDSLVERLLNRHCLHCSDVL